MIGRTPWEVSRDAELLFEAHAAAYRFYRPTPIMPPILDAMLETGTGCVIAPCETDQAAFMKKIWDRTGVRVCVNTDVEVIARGKTEDRHSQRRTRSRRRHLTLCRKCPKL